MNPDEAVALANAKYREAVEVETLIYEEAVRKATEAQRTYIERIQIYEEAVRKAREAQRTYIERTQLWARELESRLQEIELELPEGD